MINNLPESRASLSDPIRRALAHSGVVDMTTTGRRSGLPRRIEIVYHAFGGHIYISGMPRRQRRSWLANLEQDPAFTLHLKGPLSADVAAHARVVTDPKERRAVMRRIIETAWPRMDLEAMVAYSPLIEVTVDQLAA